MPVVSRKSELTKHVEYEIKGLVADFDKIARKQIARLKKGKYTRLETRANILNSYGLRSRERMSKRHSRRLKLI